MRNTLIFILLVIIVSGGTYGFFLLYEYYEEEVDIGYSLQARQNPYLAAELFLQEHDTEVYPDIRAKEISRLKVTDALFIERADIILASSTRIDQALNWVEQGGSLILGASTPSNSATDSIFQRLNIAINENKDFSPSREDLFDDLYRDTETLEDTADEKELSKQLREINRRIREGKAEDDKEPEEQYTDSTPVTVQFEGTKDTLTVNFSKYLVLKTSYDDALFYSAGDGSNTYLAQIRYGKGIITVLADSELWQSPFIGQADNAYFLKLLTNDRALHIIYNLRNANLWQLLLEFAPELLAITALIIILWILLKSLRIGRIITPPPIARRAFTDHVLATADFYMSEKRQDILLCSVKKLVFDELQRRDRHITQYTIPVQAEIIADFCRVNQTYSHPEPLSGKITLNQEAITFWLQQFEQENITEAAFVKQIQLSDMIRKQL